MRKRPSTILRLSHQSLKGVSTQTHTLSECKPLKGFLRSSSIILEERLAFKVVVLKLKNNASFWYENLKRQQVKNGKGKIKT